MPNHDIFTDKESALIAIGAAVAAGCQPCTAYLVKAARIAGACERGVSLAVETALAVRENATRVMDEWAGQCQGGRPQLDAGFRAEKRPIAELAAVAAAAAVNSVPDMRAHLDAARESGATPEQIRAAIAIAGKVKTTAEREFAAAMGYQPASPEREVAAEEPKNCGCR
jgi:alkylhydroperoxidase/carboxymuconolactone decarboxylase family protein YurZ